MTCDRTNWLWSLVGLAVVLGGASKAIAYVPTENTGTGPNRRVYANTGYDYMSASVTLPSASQVQMNDGDTAYIYTGGWGTNGSTPVDAGFQYSPTYNDWSLFEDVSGIGDYVPGGLRYKAGQTMTLSFGVSAVSGSSATLQVIANGINVDGTQVQEQVSVPKVPNWAAGSDTLKRMTSIAQADGDDFTDGSFNDDVHWFNSDIGTSSSNAVSWLASETGGYQSYTSSVVSVSYVNAGNETDSINLTGGDAIAAVAEVPEPAMLPAGMLVALGIGCMLPRSRSGSLPRRVLCRAG